MALEFTNKPEDHPRRCGENVVAFSTTPLIVGSPPQVRGKLSAVCTYPADIGITPAGAGKTSSTTQDLSEEKDHPRRCVENILSLLENLQHLGSPPQVRGKLHTAAAEQTFARITPAGAGKTKATLNERFVNHGSPPQVRGKLVV